MIKIFGELMKTAVIGATPIGLIYLFYTFPDVWSWTLTIGGWVLLVLAVGAFLRGVWMVLTDHI